MRLYSSLVKRYIALVLIFCTLVSTFATFNIDYVIADSTDMRRTYIDLMSGKRTINATDISKLTNSDLQCLAVYLSNFYVPYNTSIDGANVEPIKEAMSDALKKTGFSQDTANTFVDLIFQSSTSSAQKLYIRSTDFPMVYKEPVVVTSESGNPYENGTGYQETENSKLADVSHFPFGFESTADGWFSKVKSALSSGVIALVEWVSAWLKGGDDQTIKDEYKNRGLGTDPGIRPFKQTSLKEGNGERTSAYEDIVGQNITVDDVVYTPLTVWIYNMILKDFDKSILEKGKDKVQLYWQDGSVMKPCFVFDDITLSQIATFTKELGSDKGLAGNAVLNTSLDAFVDASEKDRAKLTSITQCMYIDWAGNILADFGTERVIMYPGCINPYLFGSLGDSPQAPISRWNVLSTWGAYALNSDLFGVTYSNGSFTLGNKINAVFDYTWSRGTAGGLSGQVWDDVAGIGKGKPKVVQDFFKSVGFETGANDSWGDTSFNVSITDGFTLNESNTVSDFLMYTTIASQTDLTDGSNFAVSSALPTGSDPKNDSLVASRFFDDKGKFSSLSDDMHSFMQMTGGSTGDTGRSGDYVMLSNFFITYAFAFNNKNKGSDAKDSYVNVKYMGCFPKVLDQELIFDEASSEADQEKITSFIYYLLHPTEGVSYFVTLVKNKLGGLLIGWHEDMAGGSDSNSTTGMTKYLGTSGYVTTPNLYELKWLDKLLVSYDNIIVYLIIFMGVILLCYILVGSMTVARAIVGVLSFALFAFIPPVAINTTTDLINSVCDTIYSKKFDYWAYTQLRTYLDKLQQVNSAYTMTDYVNSMLDLQVTEYESAGGYGGVRLKWMTPKKFTDVGSAESELSEKLSNTFSQMMINMMGQVLATTHSTEDYKDCVGQTYLYRDFMDIYMYASQSYNAYKTYNYSGSLGAVHGTKLPAYFTGNSDAVVNSISHFFEEMNYYSGKNMKDYLGANDPKTFGSSNNVVKNTSSLVHTYRGFLVDSAVDNKGQGDVHNSNTNDLCYYNKKRLALSYPVIFYHAFAENHANYNKLKNILDSDDGSIKVTSGLANGSQVYGIEPYKFCYTLKDLQSAGDDTLTPDIVKSMSYFYYALYCESPYYFFNNNIRDHIVNYVNDGDSGNWYAYNPDVLSESSEHFHKMLLEDNQKYFFNLTDNSGDGYGELRDFMNMHDLFYYIIPMMREGNDTIELWDKAFGMYVYPDCNLNITESGIIEYGGKPYGTVDDTIHACENAMDELVKSDEWRNQMTDEQKYKVWHNYNVWCLFNSYCTWLDTMMDCNYAKDEFINVMGERFHVINPLDPTCYYEEENGEMTAGRYMVFSRSEMKYYGLDISDLTTVEQKIIQCQDNVYKQTLDVMNYYKLSDEVLINAFAMIETFEFNKIFSQSSIIGNDYMMYPQGYEAKAFTYDAYLRLIMSEASGESLQVSSETGETSIYRRIIKNTSIFYGVFLLINDIISIYCIPILRIAFLVMIFFISIALIVAASIKLELNLLTTIWKSLVAPLASYFAVSVGFAFIVSLFMSNGADKVTATNETIHLGDPTMVLIVMIVINIAVTIMYFKICKKCFKDLKNYLESIITSISSTVVGAMGAIMGGFAIGKRAGEKAVGAISSAAHTAAQRGRDNIPGAGGSGLVAAAGVGAGVSGVVDGLHANGLGLDSDEAKAGLDPAVREKLKKQDERAEGKVGMNKYTAKAFDKSNAMADKAADASARHRKLAEKGGLAGKYHAWRSGGLERKKDFYNDKAKNLSENGGVSAAVKNAGSRIKYMASGGSLNIAGRNGNAFNNRSKQLNVMQEEHNAGVKNLQARRERQEAAWQASVDTNKRTQQMHQTQRDMHQTQQDMQSTQNTMHTRQRNMNRTLTSISQERNAKF